MILSNKKIIPPKEWEHKPEIKNNENNTVARILVGKKIIPPF